MTRFRWGTATDVGRTRTVNQDSVYSVEGFFAVADGMGGHRGGEVASAVALESLQASLPVLSTDDLLDAITESNLAVLERAGADPNLRGMGTTLCVLALVDDGTGEPSLVLANVGDSRIYQLVNGMLEQRTDDHSMVGEMLRQGRITAEEAATHPQRNIVTRALGIDPDVQIDAWRIAPTVGQRWMLCSDGLSNEVDDATLASVLATVGDPVEAAHELVRLANEGGGRDNITVLVVDVVDELGHAAVAGGAAAAAVPDEPVEALPPRVAAAAPTQRVAQRGEPGESFARRALDQWRVMLFGAALLAVAVVALVAWLVLGDDSVELPPPVPTSTTVTTSTLVTAGVTSTTSVVGPAGTGTVTG